MTILAKLEAYQEDTCGYITYVFECLDEEIRKETKYLMVTQFPNWNHRKLVVGEVGFLNFMEIKAGLDKWYDGTNMIEYKYNNIQFLKFIEKKENSITEFRM